MEFSVIDRDVCGGHQVEMMGCPWPEASGMPDARLAALVQDGWATWPQFWGCRLPARRLSLQLDVLVRLGVPGWTLTVSLSSGG